MEISLRKLHDKNGNVVNKIICDKEMPLPAIGSEIKHGEKKFIVESITFADNKIYADVK